MTVKSLTDLTAAFNRWRRNKRYIREQVPKELWEQAISATRVYGTGAVAQATKIQGSRLVDRNRKAQKKKIRDRKAKTKRVDVPAFSRISIAAPSATTCPIAEIETAEGVKLRVFVQTDETLNLLSSLCGNTGGS